MKNANPASKFKLTKTIVTRFAKGAVGPATAPTSYTTVTESLTILETVIGTL